MAVLMGNPSKPGMFTIRLKAPANYKVPAHWHPMAENLTVISGTFYLAMGDKAVDGAAKRYVAGDFLNVPGKMSHFGHVASGRTVDGVRNLLQLTHHGIGCHWSTPRRTSGKPGDSYQTLACL